MMSVIFENKATHNKIVFTKGAVEYTLSSYKLISQDQGSGLVEKADDHRDSILQHVEALAAQGSCTGIGQ